MILFSGLLVCANCSPHQKLLPNIDAHSAVRVCHRCVVALETSEDRTSSSTTVPVILLTSTAQVLDTIQSVPTLAQLLTRTLPSVVPEVSSMDVSGSTVSRYTVLLELLVSERRYCAGLDLLQSAFVKPLMQV